MEVKIGRKSFPARNPADFSLAEALRTVDANARLYKALEQLRKTGSIQHQSEVRRALTDQVRCFVPSITQADLRTALGKVKDANTEQRLFQDLAGLALELQARFPELKDYMEQRRREGL